MAEVLKLLEDQAKSSLKTEKYYKEIRGWTFKKIFSRLL